MVKPAADIASLNCVTGCYLKSARLLFCSSFSMCFVDGGLVQVMALKHIQPCFA